MKLLHGDDLKDLKCMGFIFGRKERVCYLSDISRMLPATLDKIKESEVDLLIVVALFISFLHPFHYSLKQAIEMQLAYDLRRLVHGSYISLER